MAPSSWLFIGLVALLVLRWFWMRRGINSISATDLQARLEAKERLVIADVREDGEYRSGHIPAALSVPLSRVEKAAERLDPSAQIVLVCASGNRSLTAYRRLSAMGYQNLLNLTGGMSAWRGAVKRG